MNRLPPNREEGSTRYGSDLCTPCVSERYEAMKRSPGGQAYWQEFRAKEYSAASLVAESTTARRADGKLGNANRLSGGPQEPTEGAPVPEVLESYSPEEIDEVLQMTPEELKECLKEGGHSDDEIDALLKELVKLRKEDS